MYGLGEDGVAVPSRTDAKCWALKNRLFPDPLEAATRVFHRGVEAGGTRIAIDDDIFVGGTTTVSVFVSVAAGAWFLQLQSRVGRSLPHGDQHATPRARDVAWCPRDEARRPWPFARVPRARGVACHARDGAHLC